MKLIGIIKPTGFYVEYRSIIDQTIDHKILIAGAISFVFGNAKLCKMIFIKHSRFHKALNLCPREIRCFFDKKSSLPFKELAFLRMWAIFVKIPLRDFSAGLITRTRGVEHHYKTSLYVYAFLTCVTHITGWFCASGSVIVHTYLRSIF